MAKRFPLGHPQFHTHCQACGESVEGQKAYYMAGQYHPGACYDTLFADCLVCGKHCMDARSNLSPTNHINPLHTEQICDNCMDKKYGWVTVTLRFGKAHQ